MDPLRVGVPLHPDAEYLDLVAPLLAGGDADILEVAPETGWRLDERGDLHPNRYHAAYLALGERHRLPFIAHGVGLSVGSVGAPQRRARWLARIAEDQRSFGYRWYTDHLGATVLGDHEMSLPLGLPMTAASVEVVRACLGELRRIVPRVGLENTAIYFALGDPRREPDFLMQIVGTTDHLLLDLHNLHTMAANFGLDPDDYLAGLDLSRVLEIHLAGGRDSDPQWLRSRRTLRLDSHDDHVPEAVWRLYERVLPRCPGLRAVVVERMEGTLEPGDERALADELRRARRLAQQLHRPGPDTPPTPRAARPLEPTLIAAQLEHERALAELLRADDPIAALAGAPPALQAMLRDGHPDGLRIAAMFVARMRFERLQHGDLAAARAFETDPAGFTARFRDYHASVPPTAAFPPDEATLYRRWSG